MPRNGVEQAAGGLGSQQRRGNSGGRGEARWRTHAVPLGGPDGAKRGTSAGGAPGVVGAEVAASDAVHAERATERATKKGMEVVGAIGDRPLKEQEMDELFALVEADFLANNRDGDGVISSAEFGRVGVQRSLSKARVDKILREADADQDGVLSFSEYLDAVSNWEVST